MLRPKLTIKLAAHEPFNGRPCVRWLFHFRLVRSTECVWHRVVWRLFLKVRWLPEEGDWFAGLGLGSREVALRRDGGRWSRLRRSPPPDFIERDGVRITVTTDYVAPCLC